MTLRPSLRRAIARPARVKPTNRKRRATAFAQAYHSRERVAFVKGLQCVMLCGTCDRPIDNAHTGEKPGKGLKAAYQTIVPLCRSHHCRYDQYREPFNIVEVREAIQAIAKTIETLWIESQR